MTHVHTTTSQFACSRMRMLVCIGLGLAIYIIYISGLVLNCVLVMEFG